MPVHAQVHGLGTLRSHLCCRAALQHLSSRPVRLLSGRQSQICKIADAFMRHASAHVYVPCACQNAHGCTQAPTCMCTYANPWACACCGPHVCSPTTPCTHESASGHATIVGVNIHVGRYNHKETVGFVRLFWAIETCPMGKLNSYTRAQHSFSPLASSMASPCATAEC